MATTLPSSPRRGFDWLAAVAGLAVVGAFAQVVFFTPIELRQGAAQKIFYVHLPAAFVGLYIAFGLVAVTSLLYLWLKEPRLDLIAESSAEVGLMFTTVVLVTGPIWGKPVWGTWWTWDARLTSTLFLWFIYLGYLILRGAVEERGMRARYSAVLGILGALLIPFIHLSVYYYRTMHPMPIVLKPDAPSLPPEMLRTLLIAFGATALLYVALLRARYRLAVRRERLANLLEDVA